MTTSTSTWRLAVSAVSPEDGTKSLALGRLLEPGERERVQAARATLTRWAVDTPLSGLTAAHAALLALIRDTYSLESPYLDASHVRALQSAVADWLSKFRAFADQTPHLISGDCGKDSLTYTGFQQSLRAEFDRNKSYRLCCKLRNYTQHAGDPVQRVQLSTSLVSQEPYLAAATLTLEFDPQELLRRSKDWGAIVRPDLERLEGNLPVVPVLESALMSCIYAFSTLVRAERDRLTDAIDLIETYALGDKHRAPLFFCLPAEAPAVGSTMNAPIEYVPLDVAAQAASVLARADEAVRLRVEVDGVQPN